LIKTEAWVGADLLNKQNGREYQCIVVMVAIFETQVDLHLDNPYRKIEGIEKAWVIFMETFTGFNEKTKPYKMEQTNLK